MSVLNKYRPKTSSQSITRAGTSLLNSYRPGVIRRLPAAPQLPPAESGQVSSSPFPDPALLEPVVTPQMTPGQPFDTMMTDEEAALLDSMVDNCDST